MKNNRNVGFRAFVTGTDDMVCTRNLCVQVGFEVTSEVFSYISFYLRERFVEVDWW